MFRLTPLAVQTIAALHALALVVGCLALPGSVSADTRTSLQQVQEAWLASDASVYGKYKGPSPEHGLTYHEIDVDEVWLGTPSRGSVLFKAPRGIKAEPGDQILLMLWDELNGATHAFLQKAQRLYGDDTWDTIGPDSITTYLLPFSRFAFRFEKGRIDLRGTKMFGDPVKKRDLKDDMFEFEDGLAPAAQFATATAVVEAVAEQREFKMYEVEGVPVELRVHVSFRTMRLHKGDVPDHFSLTFGSFPRSPRFEEGDSVLMFLGRREGSRYLVYGKRGVFHIEDGQVLEVGQPLREFVKAMLEPAP